jgi:O-antigen/teichoic acid export membrane protein
MAFSAVVVSVLYLVTIIVLRNFVLEWIDAWLIPAILLPGLAFALFSLLSEFCRFEERHSRAVLFRAVPILLAYASGLAGACLFSRHVLGFFLGVVVGLLLCTPLTFSVWRSVAWGSKPDPAGPQDTLARDSLPYLGIVLFGWLSGYGNSVVIWLLLSEAAVAEYMFVCTFGFAMLLVINAVSQAWFPRFLALAASLAPRELNEINGNVYKLQVIATGAAAGLLVVLFPEAVVLLGGNAARYGTLLPYLSVLLSGYIVLNGYYRSHVYFLLHNKGLDLLRIYLWVGVASVLLWAFLIWLVGPWGIYVGFLLAMAVRGTSIAWAARRRWGLPPSLGDVMVGLAIISVAYCLTVTVHQPLLRVVIYALGASCVASITCGPAVRQLNDPRVTGCPQHNCSLA